MTVVEYMKSELERLDKSMLDSEEDFKNWLDKVHPEQYKSACNLLHYLVLRSKDICKLQDKLHEHGLSSLASSESHVRSQLSAILNHLETDSTKEPEITYKSSIELVKKKCRDLFGPSSKDLTPFIMVTLDTSHAEDYPSIKNLLQSGMNVARINCAHDAERVWLRMIEHVKKASLVTCLPCKIYMDLPGAKIRTFLPNKNKKKPRLKVHEGDVIWLGDESLANKKKRIIGCTLPDVASQLKNGQRVLIDDGLIEAKVTDIKDGLVQLEILRLPPKKRFIKTEKGLNFPDTQLVVPSLSCYDLKYLQFIQEHADIVGFSFVQNAKDLFNLQQAMKVKKLPVVLKIETLEAVKNLPELLLEGMREALFAVMIARGDLAIEIGFERLSEIQEEILWICEAGHVPVIWATQVLESLNKSGLATRSEVTDAAHAVMAECVMINKGQHTIEVIEALKDILFRSGRHHAKKRYTFRALSIAGNFIEKVATCRSNSSTKSAPVLTMKY